MDDKLKSNLLSEKHWLRLLFIVLFALAINVATVVMWVIVTVQFIFSLCTGKDNPKLRALGDSLSQFIFQIFRFMTYNTDDKPFPFADWPEPEVREEDDEEEDDDNSASAEVVVEDEPAVEATEVVVDDSPEEASKDTDAK
jgi:hypothetical protein